MIAKMVIGEDEPAGKEATSRDHPYHIGLLPCLATGSKVLLAIIRLHIEPTEPCSLKIPRIILKLSQIFN
jgi:hypothetical protein